MSSSDCKIAILGGGLTGLCAAHYAGEAVGPEHVVLLDASDRLGGVTGTDRAEGFVCDWGPNGFLDKEPQTLEWIDSLGLTSRLVQADQAAAHRFILKGDRLVEVVMPPRFFVSPLLSFKGRVRLCCEPLLRPRQSDRPESIWDFAARRIGREAADMMVAPMVLGIFAGNAKELSLQHCFPRMAAIERDHGGLVKALVAKRLRKEKVSPTGPRGRLTSFREGIGVLAEEAARQCRARVRTGAGVIAISRSGSGYTVATVQGEQINAEKIILALPAYAAAAATRVLSPGLSNALADIPYVELAVMCVGYRREQVGHDLNGFGFLVPPNSGRRVLGCLWTSTLFPGRAPEGHVQLRIMLGGAFDPAAVDLSDEELLHIIRKEIHPVLAISGEPVFGRVFRHRRAIPQYTLQHGSVLAQIETALAKLPGFALAGNAYHGVGLNDCVVSARAAARFLTE